MEESEDHQLQQRKLSLRIAKVLDEARISQATHIRKLKELADLRSSRPPIEFFAAFSKAITPLFNFHRRTASADHIIKFVAVFACSRNAKDAARCDEILENFMRFLIVASGAANKTVRFRACQMVSEIIMRLPDDAEVSNELWDEVIECVKLRVDDKVSAVRTFAVRALSRFANDSENRDILDLFLEKLTLEQNADVRKTFVLSLPPSSDTLTKIIDCTLDVNETVRKAAYCVIGSKFPLQSLSIKLRTVILQRGLSDRSPAVAKECLKLMKDEWLEKCCNGDPTELLRYIDVETYELIGESVMVVLLKEELIKLQDGQTIRKFLASEDEGAEGQRQHSIELMDSEVALFWKMVCKHLQIEAQIANFNPKKTAAEKSYLSALCRILVLLHFRTMEQDAIKLMRRLLNRITPSMAAEKDIVKELRQMAECLRAVDRNPDERSGPEQAHLILGKLGLEMNLDEVESTDMPPTPAPQSTRRARPRR